MAAVPPRAGRRKKASIPVGMTIFRLCIVTIAGCYCPPNQLSGHHALLELGAAEGEQGNFRWDAEADRRTDRA